MASTNDQPAAEPTTRKPRISIESARYGVLRRLSPSLKHDMMVHLQALTMLTEVLNSRLERGSLTQSDFQGSIGKLNRLAREAVTSCLNVVAWIQPVEDEAIRLPQGVEECLALLASNFNFRGITLNKQVAETSFDVSRMALRHLLCGTLITLTDAAGGPCDVSVKAEIVSGFAEISVRVEPRPGAEGRPLGVGYRQLDWADLQALAIAERVELVRSSDRISMRVPRIFPTTPLQIAPL